MDINNILSRINWFFIIILVLISSIGIALLYSIAGGSWEPWASNQIIRISIGLLVLILVSFVHVRAVSYTHLTLPTKA